MQTISFTFKKQKLAEFVAENMEFARQPEGLLVTAEGEMVFQDTPSMQEIASTSASCVVTIVKDGETVVDQLFQATFFTLEADQLAVLLQ
jgi:hypothetical protein